MKKLWLISLIILFASQVQAVEIVKTLKPKRMSGQGLYVTHYVAHSPKRLNYLVKQARQHGLNTFVIDAKWELEKPFLELIKQKKLNGNTKPIANPWLTKIVKKLHDQGFIVTTRIVVFKDDHLVIARPDLGVATSEGGLYRDRKQGRWADPYSDEVRLYNALIAESAALCGVDEVQFDYIRFPAEGNAWQAVYPHKKTGVSKVSAICMFLQEARQRLEQYNTSIGVDVFGVTAWGEYDNREILGQDVKRMAKFIDVISPMFYPSHYHSGFDGIKNPGSHPYYFLSEGIRKTKLLLSGEAVKIVPWLQGFNLLSPSYGPDYILEQILAGQDQGVDGFLVWNARNIYEIPFQALAKQKKLAPVLN